VWDKKQSGSFQNAKYMPLQIEEDIIVFSYGRVNYYPIMRTGKMRKRGGAKEKSRVVGSGLKDGYENYSDQYYPTNIIDMANPRKNKLHPTEKPVALLEYLIQTYSREGDTVLDNCAGSGSTGVACINTNRNYILIEKDLHYFEIMKERMNEAKKQHK
jgi:site-specific DNA-methyltransferase (adenine-specific)